MNIPVSLEMALLELNCLKTLFDLINKQQFDTEH